MKSPGDSLEVKNLDPGPYVTQDPYRLPYRNLHNHTTTHPGRVVRVSQFSQKVVLRSSTTVFHVNVTQGPLIVDLKFDPIFSDPDQTDMAVGIASFIHPNAEVSIYDDKAHGEPIARDGYGGIYSDNLEKRVTVYREGPHIITLSGNFVDVEVFITTGSAPEITDVSTLDRYDEWDEYEDW